MKRYGIFPIIGDGDSENPYRSSVSDVGQTNSSSLIPTKIDGTPKYGFAFSIFATSALPSVLAISNSYVFPDYSLDAQMDGMESQTRTDLVQSVQAYNLDGLGYGFDATHADTDSYRELIQRLMQDVEPVATVNALNCSEV